MGIGNQFIDVIQVVELVEVAVVKLIHVRDDDPPLGISQANALRLPFFDVRSEQGRVADAIDANESLVVVHGIQFVVGQGAVKSPADPSIGTAYQNQLVIMRILPGFLKDRQRIGYDPLVLLF